MVTAEEVNGSTYWAYVKKQVSSITKKNHGTRSRVDDS